ncbi:4476_t:CDS:2, partial [Scutellospora calospora]
VSDNPRKLGICEFHFNLDQTPDLHPTELKQNTKPTSALISYKQYLYCNYNFYIFTRGTNCKAHTWYIISKDIMLLYITLYIYNTLITHESIDIFIYLQDKRKKELIVLMLTKMRIK